MNSAHKSFPHPSLGLLTYRKLTLDQRFGKISDARANKGSCLGFEVCFLGFFLECHREVLIQLPMKRSRDENRTQLRDWVYIWGRGAESGTWSNG